MYSESNKTYVIEIEVSRRPKSRMGEVTSKHETWKKSPEKEMGKKSDDESKTDAYMRKHSVSPKRLSRPKSRMGKSSRDSSTSAEDERKQKSKSKSPEKLSQGVQQKSPQKRQEDARNEVAEISKDFTVDGDSEVEDITQSHTTSPKSLTCPKRGVSKDVKEESGSDDDSIKKSKDKSGNVYFIY